MIASLHKSIKKGWNKELVNGQTIYTPDNLESGKQFCFVVFPVEDTGTQNLREWFSFRIAQLQNSLGKPENKWNIKTEKDGSLGVSNTFTHPSGEKLSVGYNGIPVHNAHAFIIQMISSNDISTLLRYGSGFEDVLKDAKQSLASTEIQAK